VSYKNILVIGGGAIGGITAAALTQKGEKVVIVDADSTHVAAMRHELEITGCRELKIPMQVYTPDEIKQRQEFAGWADIVLLAVKGLFTEEALRPMVPCMVPGAPVVLLQNGVNEEAVADVVGAARTIGASITWGGTNKGPGKLIQTSIQTDMAGFVIGPWPTGKNKMVQDAAALLGQICQTDVTENIRGHKWTKMLINVGLTGVGACAGINYGSVLDNESARKACVVAMTETWQIGSDLGIEFGSLNGISPKVFTATNKKEFEEVSKMLFFAFGNHRDIKPSMWQDIEKGRKSEVDFVNGCVVKQAREIGKSAPVNEMVVKILHEIENGVKTFSWNNLKEFDNLIDHLN